MNKNFNLYVLAAVFALLGASLQAERYAGDWFEGARRPQDRAAYETGRPVAGVFEEVETEGGNQELRLMPVEGAVDTVGNTLSGIFGGGRRDRGYYR